MISVTEKLLHYTFANMDKIPSFKVNHKQLKQGIYVSRVDEPNITTYDIRVIEPGDVYLDDVVPDTLLGPAFHTIEHWGATYFRSKACEFNKDVIYFGPMGCLTGFYLILKGTHSITEVWEETAKMFTNLTAIQSIPGASAEECGRYGFHDLASAKRLAWHFLNVLNEGPVPERTTYPIGKVLFLCAMEEEAERIKDKNCQQVHIALGNITIPDIIPRPAPANVAPTPPATAYGLPVWIATAPPMFNAVDNICIPPKDIDEPKVPGNEYAYVSQSCK